MTNKSKVTAFDVKGYIKQQGHHSEFYVDWQYREIADYVNQVADQQTAELQKEVDDLRAALRHIYALELEECETKAISYARMAGKAKSMADFALGRNRGGGGGSDIFGG